MFQALSNFSLIKWHGTSTTVLHIEPVSKQERERGGGEGGGGGGGEEVGGRQTGRQPEGHKVQRQLIFRINLKNHLCCNDQLLLKS